MKGFGLLGLILALLAIVLMSGYYMAAQRKNAALLEDRLKSVGAEMPNAASPENAENVRQYIEDQVKANSGVIDQRLKCSVDLDHDCAK